VTDSGDRRFLTTQWSVVLAAARPDGTTGARAALADLCGAYWFPLYAFARRRGASADEAADLTQGFFAELLEKGAVGDADRTRGRFRTFLLAAFRHHWSRQRERAAAAKRGGGKVPLSLDFDDGARRWALEPASDRTPEREFERRWALTTLERALEQVRSACDPERFDALSPFLTAGTERPSYTDTAERLGLSESAVKSAIRRLRLDYRAALRAEIAGTLTDERDLEAEIRDLMDALAG